MKTYSISELSSIDTSVLLPLYEGASIPREFFRVSDRHPRPGSGSRKTCTHILAPKKLLLLGLGKAEEMTPEKSYHFRETIGAAVRSAKKTCVSLLIPQPGKVFP